MSGAHFLIQHLICSDVPQRENRAVGAQNLHLLGLAPRNEPPAVAR